MAILEGQMQQKKLSSNTTYSHGHLDLRLYLSVTSMFVKT